MSKIPLTMTEFRNSATVTTLVQVCYVYEEKDMTVVHIHAKVCRWFTIGIF